VDKNSKKENTMSRKLDTKKTPSTETAKVEAPAAGATPDRPARFDPFAQMHLGEWFERWPEIFARRWPESFQGVPFGEAGFRMEQFIDTDNSMVIRGELPGLDVDKDVTITLDGGRLVIAGKREERMEEKSDGSFRSEFHYGSFERSVRLPAGARANAIEASYNKGILEVRVPCDAEEPAVTKIPIGVSD
jgi:HSP20 family protein